MKKLSYEEVKRVLAENYYNGTQGINWRSCHKTRIKGEKKINLLGEICEAKEKKRMKRPLIERSSLKEELERYDNPKDMIEVLARRIEELEKRLIADDIGEKQLTAEKGIYDWEGKR